jgi:hypothetical protein
MDRQQVYEVINREREYQDSLWPRDDHEGVGQYKWVAPHMLLLEEYTEALRTKWKNSVGEEDCLREIESSPLGCALRAMLDNWYKGKECGFCHRVFDIIHWFDHKPALLSPEGKILEWEAVPPEQIPDLLNTHRPVCWNCRIVENFRIEHPELVTDRHR